MATQLLVWLNLPCWAQSLISILCFWYRYTNTNTDANTERKIQIQKKIQIWMVTQPWWNLPSWAQSQIPLSCFWYEYRFITLMKGVYEWKMKKGWWKHRYNSIFIEDMVIHRMIKYIKLSDMSIGITGLINIDIIDMTIRVYKRKGPETYNEL